MVELCGFDYRQVLFTDYTSALLSLLPQCLKLRVILSLSAALSFPPYIPDHEVIIKAVAQIFPFTPNPIRLVRGIIIGWR